MEGQPYEVLYSQHLKMQQRRPVMQTKIKNLLTGKVIEKNFQQSDYFEEADIQKKEVKFLYSSRDEFWFSEVDDSSNPHTKRGYMPSAQNSNNPRSGVGAKRFKLGEKIIGNSAQFLKPNIIITSLLFNGTIINIELPVKIDFKVIEAPPSVRGNTAQGGTKQVKLETGIMMNVPLFINEGDVVRINTQTGEYAERVEKK